MSSNIFLIIPLPLDHLEFEIPSPVYDIFYILVFKNRVVSFRVFRRFVRTTTC